MLNFSGEDDFLPFIFKWSLKFIAFLFCSFFWIQLNFGNADSQMDLKSIVLLFMPLCTFNQHFGIEK